MKSMAKKRQKQIDLKDEAVKCILSELLAEVKEHELTSRDLASAAILHPHPRHPHTLRPLHRHRPETPTHPYS